MLHSVKYILHECTQPAAGILSHNLVHPSVQDVHPTPAMWHLYLVAPTPRLRWPSVRTIGAHILCKQRWAAQAQGCQLFLFGGGGGALNRQVKPSGSSTMWAASMRHSMMTLSRPHIHMGRCMDIVLAAPFMRGSERPAPS